MLYLPANSRPIPSKPRYGGVLAAAGTLESHRPISPPAAAEFTRPPTTSLSPFASSGPPFIL